MSYYTNSIEENEGEIDNLFNIQLFTRGAKDCYLDFKNGSLNCALQDPQEPPSQLSNVDFLKLLDV